MPMPMQDIKSCISAAAAQTVPVRLYCVRRAMDSGCCGISSCWQVSVSLSLQTPGHKGGIRDKEWYEPIARRATVFVLRAAVLIK